MGTARANTNVNFWCHANSDYANTVRITPLAPERTLVRASWLVREDALEGRDYDPGRVVEVHATTMAEDWAICRRVALGLRSSAHEPGPLSPDREQNVAGFLCWYLRTMRADA
jgi:glycine betaine monooxygenase A